MRIVHVRGTSAASDGFCLVTLAEEDSRHPQDRDEDGEVLGTVSSGHTGHHGSE